jgi:hypothetical protein
MLKRTTLFLAAALVLTITATAGCTTKKPAAVTGSTSTATSTILPSDFATGQASVEPTEAADVKASGPITTPATGSATRKALLDAARAELQSTTSFYVYQLYVQGDTALGDIDSVSKTKNGRVFVAWERTDGKWTAIAVSTFGSTNAATTARALPSFSSELISKIDWDLKKPSVSDSSVGTSASALKASLSSAAKKWADTAMSGEGKPYQIAIIKVAKDNKGVWWGRVVVQPTGSFERLQMWAKYSSGEWSGTVQDPEPPAPSTYFPSSVISKLGL